MKKIFALLLILFVVSSTIFAGKTYYDNGSQRFTISAGVDFPLSITRFSDNKTVVGRGEKNTNLNLGGYGSITYQLNLNPHLAFGGEIGYMFNYCIDGSLLTSVPMMAKLTYLPVQGKIDLPLSLGAGFSYLSLSNGGSFFTLHFALEAGVEYFITENWGLGINSGIWIIPELYFGANSTKNALSTFIPLTLVATYRQ